jgi:NAD+ synthase (glutamine-hydrolysing)
MSTVKIGGATLNQIPFDWKNNTQNIIDAIRAARQQKIEILCLPELCITGYGCEDTFLSEWLSGEALVQLQVIVPECEEITVAVGLPVRIDKTTYNGAAVISNKKILGITLKQNLALDGVHYEPRWFKPWLYNAVSSIKVGDTDVQVGDLIYEVKGVKLGFEICEDAWRKRRRPGYRLQERGVDLILNPSASHFAMGKSSLREKEVVIDGSTMFKCVYLFVNHLGNEAGRMIYDGDIIIAQHGKLLAVNRRLSFRSFNILATDVDFDHEASSVELKSLDNKEKNEELTRAVALGLFDYLRKSKARGFVLSLSGGADSSCCAVLVAEMVKRAANELGWDNVCHALQLDKNEIQGDWKKAVSKLLTCAYQGTKNSSDLTFNAAQHLAQSIGAEFHHWTIDDEVNSYSKKIEGAIGRNLSWDSDDIAMQNIQARTRSPIIWMLANIKKAVLLT